MKGCGKGRPDSGRFGHLPRWRSQSRFNMVIASTVIASLAVAMTLSAWGAQ